MAKPQEAVHRVEDRVIKHYTNVKKESLSRRERVKYTDMVKRAAEKKFG